MGRRIRHCVFAAGVAIACAAGAAAASAQTITPLRESVARLYANITALTVYLDVCGGFDANNRVSFADALASYRQEVAPVLERLDTVLRGSMEQNGETATDPEHLYAAANNAALKRIEDLRDTHPDEFGMLCGGILKIAEERTAEFAPMRERFPEEMQMIEEWR